MDIGYSRPPLNSKILRMCWDDHFILWVPGHRLGCCSHIRVNEHQEQANENAQQTTNARRVQARGNNNSARASSQNLTGITWQTDTLWWGQSLCKHTWDLGWAFKAAFLGRPRSALGPIPGVRAPATEALAFGWLLIVVYVCCCYMWLKSLNLWIIKALALYEYKLRYANNSLVSISLKTGHWNYSHLSLCAQTHKHAH